jgi:hypothetical protein
MSGSLSSNMSCDTKYHTLNDVWTLWAHLPHDTDWSIKSYQNIIEMDNVETILQLNKIVPDTMIKNCMIFCMRKNILPTWEDVNNRDGGSFSFKISNSDIYKVWNELMMTLLTEMLIKDEVLNKSVNGITVSPKKNFCILKIWMRDVNIQNPKLLNLPVIIDTKTTLFKKHNADH